MIMTKAVQDVSIKKFFRGWKSLASKRMGLLMLAETMQKLQVISFFKRVGRKSLHETQAISHIHLLREYLLLSKSFDALRKQKLRRDVEIVKTGSFQQIRQLLALKEHFKVWRKRFNLAITKKRISNYAIAHVQDGLVKRCFVELKLASQRGKTIRQLKTKLVHSKKVQCFTGFRKVCEMLRNQNTMIFNRDRATKQSFLNFWMQEMQEKCAIKDLVVRQRFVLAQKAICALRQHTRIQRQRKYMIDQGQANNNFHLVKSVFCALSTQTSRMRHNRYALEQM